MTDHRKVSARVPSYRRHKPTDQAVVTLNGHDHYLGKYGTSASREKYSRLIAENHDASTSVPMQSVAGKKANVTVAQLILAYVRHALEYYRESPKEIEKIRLSLRPLRRLYGNLPAGDFGPVALRAVRAEMCRSLARSTVNMRIGVVKRMFRWGAGNELFLATVYEALRAVEGLRRGRSPARETTPVAPVDDVHVDVVLPLVSRPVRAMIELQRLTGMRSGEVCQMRACNIDRSDDVWTYRPAHHKTAYRGRDRLVFLGLQAQQVLTPFLNVPESAYLFSPHQAMSERYKVLRADRKSKVPPSQRDRRRHRPKKRPGDRYSVRSYYHAVRRACERAGIAPWHPHQLRHAAATRIRHAYGVEPTRVILGHASLAATEVYAERDMATARRIVREVG